MNVLDAFANAAAALIAAQSAPADPLPARPGTVRELLAHVHVGTARLRK